MNSPEYNRAYYQSHKRAMDKKHRRWVRLNRPKVRVYHQAHRLKLWGVKQELILAEKNKPCADCGGCFPPVCMDFDHLPGTGALKVANVASMMNSGFSFQQVKEEITKCELVCANCHRIRTLNRRLCRKKL